MRGLDRWTLAWLAGCVTVAVHVVDEVSHGSYGLYADVGWLLNILSPWLRLPPFREEVWLVNLIGSIVALFVLTWFVWARRGPMITASYLFAAFLTANAVLHLLTAAALKTMAAGTWTAPVMLAAGLFLFVSAAKKGVRDGASGAPV